MKIGFTTLLAVQFVALLVSVSANANLPSYIISKEIHVRQKPNCTDVHEKFREIYADPSETKNIGHHSQTMCFDASEATFIRFDLFIWSRDPQDSERVNHFVRKHDNFEFYGNILKFEAIQKVTRFAKILFGNTDANQYPYGKIEILKEHPLASEVFENYARSNVRYNEIRWHYSYDELDPFVAHLSQTTGMGEKQLIRDLLSKVNTVRYQFKDVYSTTTGKHYALHEFNLPIKIDRPCHKSPSEKCSW